MVERVIATDLTIGAGDVLLGHVGGAPFYIGKSQYEYWKHTQLILDVIDGHGGTFSLEGSTGKAFHTRSRLFTDEVRAGIEPLDARGLAWCEALLSSRAVAGVARDRQHLAVDVAGAARRCKKHVGWCNLL